MRAIVNCRLGFPPEQLEEILRGLALLPGVAQDDEIVLLEKKRILDTINESELPYVRATFKLTILEKDTRTWGIVSGDAQIEIRLLNHNPERLRRAVEGIVTRFSDYADFKRPQARWRNRLGAFLLGVAGRGHTLTPKQPDAFDFVPPVEVREVKSDVHSFSGRIRPQRLLRSFLRARRREKHLVLISGAIAILGLVATVPPIMSLWQLYPDEAWAKFVDGHIERLTTASAVVCVVWLIELYVGWSEHRHRRVVEWLPD